MEKTRNKIKMKQSTNFCVKILFLGLGVVVQLGREIPQHNIKS